MSSDRLVDVPPLVRRAERLAAARGFPKSCLPEVGRLLHVLAGQRGRSRVAEIGTGVGVGAAWIVSALAPDVPFYTVELDPQLAAAAAELFSEDPNVRVLVGDWHDLLLQEAPFDLVFLDAAKQRPDLDGEQALGLLAPGGTVVLDDLTPGRPGPDPVRDFWLRRADLSATEILTTPHTAAIVGVRTR